MHHRHDNPEHHEPHGRRRQRRGDIRVALLELLAAQPRHGYELITALEERSGGFYRPSPGSVYPTLQLLEDAGHATSTSESGRRVYTITDDGRTVLAAQGAERAAAEQHRPPRHDGPREHGALRDQAMALMDSVRQVGRHGTAAQVAAVHAILEAATRQVYAVLASPADAPTER